MKKLNIISKRLRKTKRKRRTLLSGLAPKASTWLKMERVGAYRWNRPKAKLTITHHPMMEVLDHQKFLTLTHVHTAIYQMNILTSSKLKSRSPKNLTRRGPWAVEEVLLCLHQQNKMRHRVRLWTFRYRRAPNTSKTSFSSTTHHPLLRRCLAKGKHSTSSLLNIHKILSEIMMLNYSWTISSSHSRKDKEPWTLPLLVVCRMVRYSQLWTSPKTVY